LPSFIPAQFSSPGGDGLFVIHARHTLHHSRAPTLLLPLLPKRKAMFMQICPRDTIHTHKFLARIYIATRLKKILKILIVKWQPALNITIKIFVIDF
jgi:hypothetical protein